jgi:hypothetical protein
MTVRVIHAALLLLPWWCAARPLDLRLQTTAGWAENISRSALPPNQIDTRTYEFTAGIGSRRQIFGSFLVGAELEAAALAVDNYRLNNRTQLGPRFFAQHKFGLGPYAPILQADAALLERFAKAEGDKGTTTETGLTLSKRLNQQWRISATADWSNHAARSAAFDVHHRRLHGAVTWDISERWQASAGGGRLHGIFTANASWAVWGAALVGALGPAVQEYYTQIPWRVTDLYGPGWVTYPVSGHVDFWWAELTPALTQRTALSLRFEQADALNRVGVKYRQERWTLSLLLRL